ncbi:hypothetical protein PFICI_00089 [Pestalotiopsis fici W106-1]|uniref:Carboxylic ester hydrolase n=1 Tax=Pestalotiopsis fici (strain W106-1 / CGMCC3.15140) TaxID=1229662 RepID=W3XLY7_PESFW|nr:uncharacterized protein PFICI_00089 [Pestalotiopsis fici W106-1]ETS86261.1 hypothetical protein PFICI_00089 [Pestalotiopsis fici W106-1]
MQLQTWLALGLATLAHAEYPSLTVDLGYAKYVGIHNETTGLNTWKGMRYAAPPIGDLSFRAPIEPEKTNLTISADSYGTACVQAYTVSQRLGNSPEETDQDCLFLNVYAPEEANNLPVFFYVHGGGYLLGDGNPDLSLLLNSHDGEFMAVSFNYRVGAYGFLSSEDVKQNGDLNAGILDQRLALEWVQKYVHLFGGDCSNVTIYGDSAGGGSVMLHAMAYGGADGDRLFQKVIAASPYLPKQYKYNDDYPTFLYDQFAQFSGCGDAKDKMACLRTQDMEVLREANDNVTAAAVNGTFGFAPVTDGNLIPGPPSVQLVEKKAVNGQFMLTNHNADEAPGFVPANITTEADLVDFIRIRFQWFDDEDISALLETYPLTSCSRNASNPRFATAGDSGPTAVEVSPYAVGNQQRAYAIFSEANFACPSYWLATAYTDNYAKTSYLHTYANQLALHSFDAMVYFNKPSPSQGPAFVRALRAIWGAFITTGSPNIPSAVANNSGSDVLSHWPVWGHDRMVVYNQTGGVLSSDASPRGNISDYHDPGLRNDFREVNARTWEGGRGNRCDFWKRMAPKVPM